MPFYPTCCQAQDFFFFNVGGCAEPLKLYAVKYSRPQSSDENYSLKQITRLHMANWLPFNHFNAAAASSSSSFLSELPQWIILLHLSLTLHLHLSDQLSACPPSTPPWISSLVSLCFFTFLLVAPSWASFYQYIHWSLLFTCPNHLKPAFLSLSPKPWPVKHQSSWK